MLNRTGGSSDIHVTLSYEYLRSCGVNDLATLKVVRWDGSQWTDEHGSANGTDTLSGTFTSQLVSNFSPFTFGSGSPLNPLPVSLSYFKSKCDNKNLILEWATESELNNKQFDLYFSKDATNWQHLTSVKSQGDASFTQKYQYVNPKDEGFYYKLEQTDYESTAESLQIIKSNCANDTEKNRILLYPNPVENELFIQNYIDNSLQIEIYDFLANKSEILSSTERSPMKNIFRGYSYVALTLMMGCTALQLGVVAIALMYLLHLLL
jgi:hypothetical protein